MATRGDNPFGSQREIDVFYDVLQRYRAHMGDDQLLPGDQLSGNASRVRANYPVLRLFDPSVTLRFPEERKNLDNPDVFRAILRAFPDLQREYSRQHYPSYEDAQEAIQPLMTLRLIGQGQQILAGQGMLGQSNQPNTAGILNALMDFLRSITPDVTQRTVKRMWQGVQDTLSTQPPQFTQGPR